MPSRMLCNDIKREGANPSPGLVSGLSYYVPLHNIRYGINSTVPAVVLSKETRFWVLVYKAVVVLRKSH